MGKQEPREVQQEELQSPACGKEQPQAPEHAGACPAGKYLCGKGSGGPGGPQAEHEPPMWSCGKGANSILGCVRGSVVSRSR